LFDQSIYYFLKGCQCKMRQFTAPALAEGAIPILYIVLGRARNVLVGPLVVLACLFFVPPTIANEVQKAHILKTQASQPIGAANERVISRIVFDGDQCRIRQFTATTPAEGAIPILYIVRGRGRFSLGRTICCLVLLSLAPSIVAN